MQAVHYQLGQFPPDERIDWIQLIPDIGPAAAALARYDGMLKAIPNPRLLLAPLYRREAVDSSRIEGTRSTVDEVLEFEAGQIPANAERLEDVREVLNYMNAMRSAAKAMQTLPLCQRVVRAAHETLMKGVRGRGKSPGEYRKLPTWIGPHGCAIEDASFVPVSADALPAGMAAWERYIHAETRDKLVQVAILHAEFEALHPFLDGNGRVGRMLVPLFLWDAKLIRTPAFYISAYLDAHRDAYYERLLAISRDGDWTGWCRFFLTCIKEQADENLEKVEKILDLYSRMKTLVPTLTRSKYAINVLDWIFERPLLRSSDFVSRPEIHSKPAGQRVLRALREAGILVAIVEASGRRSAILAFPELLSIIKD